ncbi:MAG: phytoene/squalene synthase family protein [Burkholderiales bacterium]
MATRDDFAACRALLRNGSRTFHAASFLLPPRVREPACALYAFCRVADDAIDGEGATDAALPDLHERLFLVYRGTPRPHAVDRAFANVVERHAIPYALPAALLEGFAWDVARRRYADLPALEDYAARVAGAVGAMMARVMGVADATTLARACDLGVAMQLSNIARDVGEDARAGRLYLPLAWLRDAGIDADAWLAQPTHSQALAGVIARTLDAADRRYTQARDGIAALPAACRPGIRAASRLYAEIGCEVRRRRFDAVSARAVVSGSRKLVAFGASLATGLRVKAQVPAPPCPATRFLVDAAVLAAQRRDAAPARPVAWWNLAARIVATLDLFERLERRDRMQRASRDWTAARSG